MNRNRYTPFGYEYRQGVLMPHPLEADAVREIYTLYVIGSSYTAIAARMTASGIMYHAGADWNKHMVKRILENPRYGGADGYPTIIDQDTTERVASVKAIKPSCKPRTPRVQNDAVPEPHAYVYAPTQAVRRLTNDINRALERGSGGAERIREMPAPPKNMRPCRS
jgi:hypothetical protein